MFGENLLNVGTEDNASENTGITGLTGDQIFAGAESHLHESEELSEGYDKLLNTAEVIEESLLLDKAGVESKTVTAEYVIAQAAGLQAILNLGINHTDSVPVVGTESAYADPLAALKVGVEAKEGLIKKIIRKAKDFIKMIISKIKEFTKKLVTSASLLFTNMRSLKDKADELDAGFRFDKKEDKESHNKFRDALGYFTLSTASNNVGKVVLEDCIANIGNSYKEGSSSNLELIYKLFKAYKDFTKEALVDNAKVILNNYGGPAGPAGSAYRALEEDKDNLVALHPLVSPAGVRLIGLKLKTADRIETATVKTILISQKVDSVTLTGALSASDIQDLAKSATQAFDNYNAKDVITALYDRLRDIDKDISEVSKTGKGKAVTRIMKFVSYTNVVSNASIKAVIANQKGAYTAIKVLVDNAE